MMDRLSESLTQGPLLYGILIFSVLTLLATGLLMPLFLLRLPSAYFIKHRKPPSFQAHHLFIKIARNLLGFLLFVLGLLLLFLPGQGLLTILASLFVCDFSGKKRFLLWVIKSLKLAKKINSYRQKHGREPFLGL